MNNFNCTCCDNNFNSAGDLKKHRKMKLQHALHKYNQYLKDINKTNNICNCLCCNCNYPPTNMNNQQEINWNNCQLRIYMSNELNPLWGNINRSEGNDIRTDLLYIINDFKTNSNILDQFINHVNGLNFQYIGFADGTHYKFDI